MMSPDERIRSFYKGAAAPAIKRTPQSEAREISKDTQSLLLIYSVLNTKPN